MAVFERTYKPYAGALSPEWSRFLIIPRHAVRDIFRSKLFTAFYALSFVWPLVCAILIYLRHNVEALAILRLSIPNVIPIDATFFMAIVNAIFPSVCGNVFHLKSLIHNVWARLLGTFLRQTSEIGVTSHLRLTIQIFVTDPPLWASWFVLFVMWALCFWLLSRKV